MSKTIQLDIPRTAEERLAAQTDWKCCGCGVFSPNRVRSCDCPTGVVSRQDPETKKSITAWKVEGGGGGESAVAAWMIENSYATGHGDTVAAMLDELEKQAMERGAVGVIEEQINKPSPSHSVSARTALANYRARLPEQGAITRGSRVSANGRDYSFSGEIVASFYKRNGTSLRYVVEDDRGVLLIHSPRTVVAEQGADPARVGSDSLSVDDAEFGMREPKISELRTKLVSRSHALLARSLNHNEHLEDLQSAAEEIVDAALRSSAGTFDAGVEAAAKVADRMAGDYEHAITSGQIKHLTIEVTFARDAVREVAETIRALSQKDAPK